MKNTEYLSNGMGGIVLPEKEARRILETSPAYEPGRRLQKGDF